jgi:DNA-binding transcriptional MocR family regulator
MHSGAIGTLFDQVDITLSKHGGNELSNQANERIAATKETLRQEIYQFALASGDRGITVKDVVKVLRIAINTAAPRLTELKRDGMLQVKEGSRRDDCSVLIPRYAK